MDSLNVDEALQEARELITQGKCRDNPHEHILEETSFVQVDNGHQGGNSKGGRCCQQSSTSSGSREPIEIIVRHSKIVSQPNSDDDDDCDDMRTIVDDDDEIASRRPLLMSVIEDAEDDVGSVRKRSVKYRLHCDSGDGIMSKKDDGAELQINVNEEKLSNADGTHQIVKKYWEARWTVQHFEFLPQWLQDNEYLRYGHRPPLPSFGACFKSIFSLHTETGNIWTHMIGCAAFLLMAIWFLTRPESHWPLQEKVVFSFFFCGAVLCLGMSFTFHTVSCHSPGVVLLFSKLDYLGISLLIVGSFIPWIYYGFYCKMEPKITYIAMVSVLAVGSAIVSFWDKFSEPRYRPLRAGVFVGLSLSGVIPTAHYIITDGVRSLFSEGAFHWMLLMAFLYLTGALLYATRTPERFYPGKFDIWFQSHQLFHMCVVVAAFVHYYGMAELATNRLQGTCPARTDYDAESSSNLLIDSLSS